MNHERSGQTIAADPAWSTLKAEVSRALGEMEQAGRPLADFPPELVKLGVALFLPLAGPAETLANLIGLTRQIADQFPGALESARGRISTAGTA
jgi:hypothetical protein